MNTKCAILSAVAIVAVSAAAQAGPSEAMAFAIGQCSSQPNEKARLACYDEIAAQLKSGTMIAAPAPQSYQAPPAPQAYQAPPAPPPVAQAPAAPVAQAVAPAPYVPPPPPVAQAPAPAPAPVAQAPQSQGSTWYDPTSWFGKDSPQKASTNPSDFGAEALPQQRTASAEAPARLDELRANVAAVAYNPSGRFTVTLDNGQIWKQLDGDTGTARFKNKGGDVVTISRGVLGSYNLVVEGRSMLFKVKRVQ